MDDERGLPEVIGDGRKQLQLQPVPGDSVDAASAKVRELAKCSRGQVKVGDLAALAAIGDGERYALALVCSRFASEG